LRSARDVVALGTLPLLLTVVAVAACYLPIRRILRRMPLADALRSE
jgi:hypothetical protein